MILTSDYYISENSERQSEYDYCINKNLENQNISKIIYFTNIENPKHQHEKIEFVFNKKRPTYKSFFEFFNLNYPNEIIIISNLDIFFDNTLDLLNQMDLSKTVLALTRYDLKNGEWVLYDENNVAQASQDTWIYKSPINVKRMLCDFNLGIPGCDNRIAFEFVKAGYIVNNNSLSLKTYHKHESNHRTWVINKPTPVPGPYHYIKAVK